MANRLRNEITKQMGGNTYLFRVSFQTIQEIEDIYDGKSLHQVLADIITNGIAANTLVEVLMAAIRGAGGDPDRSQLEDDIMEAGLNEAGEMVAEIISVGLNGGKLFDEAQKKTPPRKRLTKKRAVKSTGQNTSPSQ